MYKSFLRPLLFWFSPSMSRKVVLYGLKIVNSIPLLRYLIRYESKPTLKRTLLGIDFINPVGIASGVDIQCRFVEPLFSIGSSFVTVGPITLKGDAESIDVKSAIASLQKVPYNSGRVNMASLRVSSYAADKAKVDEMDRNYSMIYDFVDAMVIDLYAIPSSILETLMDRVASVRRFNDEYKPILVHLNEDYDDEEIAAAIHYMLVCGIDAVVIPGDNSPAEMLEKVKALSKNLIPIVVSNCETTAAVELLKNGASLIAYRDSLFKEGPAIVKKTLKTLSRQ